MNEENNDDIEVKNVKKVPNVGRKAKTFKEILKNEGYTDEDIEYLIKTLTSTEKEYFTLRYGKNYDTINYDLPEKLKHCATQYMSQLKKSIPMRLARRSPEGIALDLPNSKDKSLKEFLNDMGYSDEEIQYLIATLTPREKKYFTLKYGENFDIVNDNLSLKERKLLKSTMYYFKKNIPTKLAMGDFVKEEQVINETDLKSSLNRGILPTLQEKAIKSAEELNSKIPTYSSASEVRADLLKIKDDLNLLIGEIEKEMGKVKAKRLK